MSTYVKRINASFLVGVTVTFFIFVSANVFAETSLPALSAGDKEILKRLKPFLWLEIPPYPPINKVVRLYGSSKFNKLFQTVNGYWDGKKFRYASDNKVIRATITHWKKLKKEDE